MEDDSDILEVSPTGDIILVVGPPEEKPLRLRVLSTILRSASKVFDAMFSPPWIESSRILSPDSPQDIELPEDDPEVMKTICYALHHRPDMIPFEKMSGKETLQAAQAIDKYDLSTAMQLVTDRWFRRAVPDRTSQDLMYLVAAAALLKSYEVFPNLTWQLMITHKGSYLPFHNDQVLMDTLPPRLLLLFAERSSKLRTRLHHIILEGESDTTCKCMWSETLEKTFKRLARDYTHPYVSKTQCAIRDMIKELVPVAASLAQFRKIESCGHRDHGWSRCYEKTIRHRLVGWGESQTSICLRCLEDGVMKEDENVCDHLQEDENVCDHLQLHDVIRRSSEFSPTDGWDIPER